MNSRKNNIDKNVASGFVKEWQQFDRIDIPEYDQIAEKDTHQFSPGCG